MHLDPGVIANERPTALAGALLFALLVAVAVTTLSIRSFLPEHYIVGLLLVPPVVLKLAATVDRIEEFDETVCIYPTFYGSAAAGASWKRQHPRGRLLTVENFFEFWRQLLTPIVGDLMVMALSSSIKHAGTES